MDQRAATQHALWLVAGEVEEMIGMGNYADSIRSDADNERIRQALTKIATGLRDRAVRLRDTERRRTTAPRRRRKR